MKKVITMKKILNLALVILIAYAMISGVSANGNGAGFNATCPPVTINSVTIISDEDNATPGVQIYPTLPDNCLGVLKCDASPDPECELEGGKAHCSWNASGDMTDDYGTHCKNPQGNLVLCNFTAPDTGCPDQCEYDKSGKWIGAGLGGWTYDPYDGYMMGLKTVTVEVNVSAVGGIEHVCDGGVVKIIVDNYDLQKEAIVLEDPSMCSIDDEAGSAIWSGTFKMHYWEKPGFYNVIAEVVSCCGEDDTDAYNYFQYQETPALCIAPPGKTIDYGSAIVCMDDNATAMGDALMSNCTQCDIGSPEATIRNIGNAVLNAIVSGTDLVCTKGDCGGDKIPVSHAGTFPQQGNIWIDLGNGWTSLWNVPMKMNMVAQNYCTKTITTGCPQCTETVHVYGLPPGPHATNFLSLMINPLPCVGTGYYSQTITITHDVIEGCCQDHREAHYPDDTKCLTPTAPTPQCYEIPNRYGVEYLTTCDSVI